MNDLYRKLVDLYADDELTEELTTELETAALADPELKTDMLAMRATVEALRAEPRPEFTEESYQRVLMRLYAKGVSAQRSPDPTYLQMHLHIQG